MDFINWFSKPKEPPTLEKKSSFSQLMFNLLDSHCENIKTDRDFLQDGYMSNPIVYKCIQIRSQGVASVELELHQDITQGNQQVKTVLTNHPILDLLNKPNPFQNKKEIFKQLVIQLDSTGNAFLIVIRDISGLPIQLIVPSSLKMTIDQGTNMFPVSYTYKKNTADQKVYPIDQTTGQCDVLCIKYPNPLMTQLGMSPIQPSSKAIEIFNNGLRFNANLLKNGARPSGILSTDDTLTEEQYESITESLRSAWKGVQNAGSAPILEGGLKWQELGTSPKDLDFLQGMDAASAYIASCFGVPIPLVIDSAATYNNVSSSTLSLYENTILPLCDEILDPLGTWLVGMFKKGDKKSKSGAYNNLSLKINPDKISALEPRRTEQRESVTELINGGVITPNEGRIMLGFDTLEDEEANKLKAAMAKPIINQNSSPTEKA
jgi:HK97 family phage portal protein